MAEWEAWGGERMEVEATLILEIDGGKQAALALVDSSQASTPVDWGQSSLLG